MKNVLIKCIKKYKWIILISNIFIMINIYMLTIPPKIIGKIVDLLYDIDTNKEEIIQNLISLLVISIVMLAIRIIWKYFDTYLPRAIEKDVKDKLFSHMLRLKIKEIKNIKNGEMMSYFTKDVNEIRAAARWLLSFGTRIVYTSIFAIYAMCVNVDLKLTLLIVVPIILTILLIVKIKNKVEESFKNAQKEYTKLSEYIQESTDSIRTTKAYSQEGDQLKKFIKKNQSLKSNNIKVNMYSDLLSTIIHTCFGLCYGIAILYGSRLVLNGNITVGNLVEFNSYISLFIGPIHWMPHLISIFKRSQISYERLDKVFNLEKEKIQIKKKDINTSNLKGDIIIKNLNFNYPDSIDRVLENISINIKQGETLGIIGKIGSGKTTLMNLLLKLYQVPNGKITIGGKDINDIDIQELRDSICYITQDNFLFSTTLKENISLFKEEYENDDIEESTKNAMIYDEIANMPDGIETVIGERGVDLSGGQKQRVVISRAFLNKSNFIIFDDTFSALDNKTEQHLLKNIRELAENRTCIIISNRISDIRDSDRIIVLEDGKITEEGTHTSLVKNKKSYYNYYMEQKGNVAILD